MLKRFFRTALGGERSLPFTIAHTVGGEFSGTSFSAELSPAVLREAASSARLRPSIHRRREMASRRPASKWKPPSISTGGKKTGIEAAARRTCRKRSMPTGSISSASLKSGAGLAFGLEDGWTASKAILLRGH